MSRSKNPAVPVTREPVVLEFGGKKYEISFSFNDFVEIENLTGASVLGGIQSVTRPPLGLVRGMLFVALRRADAPFQSPDDLDEEAGLAINTVAKIWRTLLEAVYQSRAVRQDPPQAAAQS